jgi:hypothetical protein
MTVTVGQGRGYALREQRISCVSVWMRLLQPTSAVTAAYF